jgi:integrase
MRIRIGGRGQGSLLKVPGSECWRACYYVNGKEVRESCGSPDEKVARRFLKQRLAEVSADRQGLRKFVAPVAARVTVAELLDDLEADWRLRELKSLDKVRSHAKPIRAAFGDRRAVDVTSAAVDKYVVQLQAQGLENATVNRRLQVLGAALKLGVERKRLTELVRIRKLKESNVRQGFFERVEFERVVAALPDELKDLAWFAYYTGWRRRELLDFCWDMVHGDSVTLPTTKNGRPRTLHLSGDALEILRRREAARLLERDGSPYVASHVFHRRGKRIKDFEDRWHRALTAAGLSHLEKCDDGHSDRAPRHRCEVGKVITVYDKVFHDLRRTGVRNMLLAGVREGVAMKVSGHRTRSIFDRYAIVSPEETRDAMERVSQ